MTAENCPTYHACDCIAANLAAIRAIIAKARQVSPAAGMTVYVVDLERAIGLTDAASPHKLGINA